MRINYGSARYGAGFSGSKPGREHYGPENLVSPGSPRDDESITSNTANIFARAALDIGNTIRYHEDNVRSLIALIEAQPSAATARDLVDSVARYEFYSWLKIDMIEAQAAFNKAGDLLGSAVDGQSAERFWALVEGKKAELRREFESLRMAFIDTLGEDIQVKIFNSLGLSY